MSTLCGDRDSRNTISEPNPPPTDLKRSLKELWRIGAITAEGSPSGSSSSVIRSCSSATSSSSFGSCT